MLSATGTAAVVNLMPSANPVGYFSGIYPSAPLADIPEPSTSNSLVSYYIFLLHLKTKLNYFLSYRQHYFNNFGIINLF